MKLSIWSCDSPDFLITPGIRTSDEFKKKVGVHKSGTYAKLLTGSALNPLETLSGPQTPRRLSSPLTQNPGSASVKGNGF